MRDKRKEKSKCPRVFKNMKNTTLSLKRKNKKKDKIACQKANMICLALNRKFGSNYKKMNNNSKKSENGKKSKKTSNYTKEKSIANKLKKFFSPN